MILKKSNLWRAMTSRNISNKTTSYLRLITFLQLQCVMSNFRIFLLNIWAWSLLEDSGASNTLASQLMIWWVWLEVWDPELHSPTSSSPCLGEEWSWPSTPPTHVPPRTVVSTPLTPSATGSRTWSTPGCSPWSLSRRRGRMRRRIRIHFSVWLSCVTQDKLRGDLPLLWQQHSRYV